MKIFVPLCEETLPLLGAGDCLIPYQYGMTLFSQTEIIAPGDDQPAAQVNPDEAPVSRLPARPVQPPCPR